MLPFPILNQYGNVIPRKTIKKFMTSHFSMYILYHDGRLYGRGGNNRYQIGTGNTNTVTEWYLMSTDVNEFWISSGAADSPVLIKKNDNTWHFCGMGWVFGNSTVYSTVQDVTDKLGVLNNGYDELILNQQNIWYKKGTKYYRMGLNSSYNLLTGNTSALTIFTEFIPGSAIKNIYPGVNGTIVTYTDKTAKAIGYNSTALYGLPNMTTYTALTNIPNIPEIISIYYGEVSTYFNTVSGVYACGDTRFGILGNGVTDVGTYISNPVKVQNSSYTSLASSQNAAIMGTSIKNYITGLKAPFGTGSGTESNSIFTEVDRIKGTDFYINSYCSYYIENSVLYGAGNGSNSYSLLPGYNEVLTEYKALQLP